MRPCRELEDEAQQISEKYGISKRKATKLILDGYLKNKFRIKNEKQIDEFGFR